MAIGDWFDLANKGIGRSIDLKQKTQDLNQLVINLINEIGEKMSNKFLETHKISTNQVENAMKIQSNLINTQNDVSYYL